MSLTPEDFRKHAEFRYQVQRFLRGSAQHSKEVGLSEKQYQCLLAIRAWPAPDPPNISQMAKALLIEPHTAVELIDRMVSNGLLERFRRTGSRSVYLRMTAHAEEALEQIAQKNRVHLAENLQAFIEFLTSIPGKE